MISPDGYRNKTLSTACLLGLETVGYISQLLNQAERNMKIESGCGDILFVL